MSDADLQHGVVEAGMGVVQSAGELLKSVARFSWAMSVYTARQARGLLMKAAPIESLRESVEHVVNAASRPLSGPVRTAYPVGTDIQAGLVDFAFDTAGFGPQGQTAPPGTTAGLGIPVMTGGARRIAGVRTLASGAAHRPVPQPELVETLTRYQQEAASETADLGSIAVGLWKSEFFLDICRQVSAAGKHTGRPTSAACRAADRACWFRFRKHRSLCLIRWA